MDSESGGAKGHYPSARTSFGCAGSGSLQFFSESVGDARDRDLNLVAPAAFHMIERRTKLAGKTLHDPAEAVHRRMGDACIGVEPGRFDHEERPIWSGSRS